MNALTDLLFGPVVFPVVFLVIVGVPVFLYEWLFHRHDTPPPKSWYTDDCTHDRDVWS